MKSQIGILGLGIMGTGLSRNLGAQGVSLSLYNRHVQGHEENVAAIAISRYEELAGAQGFDDLPAFIESLDTPRIVLMMVPAGKSTQYVIDAVTPLLKEGDILIDGGNSHYEDTNERIRDLNDKGIQFF